MKCNKVQRFLPDYIGDELSATKRQEVEGHLTECPDCRAALNTLHEVWDGLAQQPRPHKDERFWTELTKGVITKIRKAGPMPADEKKTSLFHGWRVLVPATAAVALAIIIVGLIVFSEGQKGMWIAQEEKEALVEGAPDLSFGPLAMEAEDPMEQKITLQEASVVAEALDISLQAANGDAITDVLIQLFNGQDLDRQLEDLTAEELDELYQLLSAKYPSS